MRQHPTTSRARAKQRLGGLDAAHRVARDPVLLAQLAHELDRMARTHAVAHLERVQRRELALAQRRPRIAPRAGRQPRAAAARMGAITVEVVRRRHNLKSTEPGITKRSFLTHKS